MFETHLTTDPRGAIFIDADAYTDPEAWHRTAAELRSEAPVLRVEADGYLPFWALTRHADVFEVSRRSDIWHNTQKSMLMPEWMWDFLLSTGIDPKTLIHMDGTEHRDHRAITNDWFKPAAVRHRQGDIDAVADEFVQKMVDLGGECDFAQDIAVPYTLRVIMSIFGVPAEDEALMLKLTQGIFGAADPEYLGDLSDPVQLGTSAIAEFGEYFGALTADRQANPRDDLATVIANGQIGGCPIDDHARLWYFIIAATAGHDTTSYGLSGGVEALLRHPDQLAALAADPSLAANAAEEMIRWTSPVRHFLRYAQEDTSVGGVDIPAGGRVLLSYWSANRDEAVFADPQRFDIQRGDVGDLISFGLGVHYCLGSQFARREIRTMVSKMFERIGDLQPNGEAQWTAANFVGGVKHLPVSYRVLR
ncbi:MAG: cytochrome P450 [Acidimicrobiales bacterium]